MKKINVLVNGCNGCMGKIMCRLIAESNDLNVVAGFDKTSSEFLEFPVFNSLDELRQYTKKDSNIINVIVDFSLPECTMGILKDIALPYNIPIVIATTGFSSEQLSHIEVYSRETPIFISPNMSYEIYLLDSILKEIAPKMPGYDIEIIETHHNRKKDAPSGTAKTLANTINQSLGGSMKIVYGRTGKRESNEIGIASLRGGNIIGEHTINFFGPYDTLSITHTAYSREMFAQGAIKAIRFMYNNHLKTGLFGMEDL